MPVLLAPSQAPALHELLADANTVGLDYEIVGGTASRPRIRGLGPLESASPDEISFLSNPGLRDRLQSCTAAAVVLTPDAWAAFKGKDPAFRPVLCSQPYLMYALIAQWFDQHRLRRLDIGVHPSAIIADSAQIADDVAIGALCVVEAG